MKNIASPFFGIMLLAVVFLVTSNVPASQQDINNQTDVTHIKPSAKVPHLNEIIPLSATLSSQLAKLKNNLNQLTDLSFVEKQYTVAATDVESFVRQYKQIKEIESYNTAKVYALRQAATDKKIFLDNVSKPLKVQISRVDRWKTQWLKEKKLWDYWQSSLLLEQSPEQLKLAFQKGHKIINTGLDLVIQRLEKMLSLQAKGGEIVERIDEVNAGLHGVILTARHDYLLSHVPPLISFGYFSQFKSELWSVALEDLRSMPRPRVPFLSQHGWILLVPFCLIVLVINIIRRSKEALRASEHWKFLADRPVSSALFINTTVLAFFAAYSPFVNELRLPFIVVGGIASVRVLGLVIVRRWKKQAVYFIMSVFIVSELFVSINLPLPLSRLYIFLVSLIALCLLVRWRRQSVTLPDSGFYIWLLLLFKVFFVVIMVAELLGNAGFAAYLFNTTIASMAIALPYMFVIYMIQGGLHWVFFLSPVWQVKTLRSDAEYLKQVVVHGFAAAIVGFALLPTILVKWNVYESVLEATTSIYSYGFSIGTVLISVGMIVAAVTMLFCAYLTSQILPRVLLDEKVSRRNFTRGVKRSIGQLIRYFILLVGFVLAISFLGFDFTKLTLILSAFGVGIGFGLQGVVNNFVCGLILLFERPLTEGDTIEIGTERAHIKKIGLRSTIVTTFDHADWIIPNADLINNQVTNWTLTNRQVRLCVPVGVAYGSDVSLVVETILASAKKQKEVIKSPVPEVLFMNFGESSLDFELRVWIEDVDRRVQVRSALYHDIELNFRELNIVIPFPQRDLHLPGFEDSAGPLVSPCSSK